MEMTKIPVIIAGLICGAIAATVVFVSLRRRRKIERTCPNCGSLTVDEYPDRHYICRDCRMRWSGVES